MEAIDSARALCYGFFGEFLDFHAIKMLQDDLLQKTSLLAEHPLDERSARALRRLGNALKDPSFVSIYERDYTDVFILAERVRTPVSPFYSHYAGGSIQGAHYLELKNHLAGYDFTIRADFKESEEYIGFLYLFMQYLIEENRGLKEQQDFYNAYVGLTSRGFIKGMDEFVNADIALMRENAYEMRPADLRRKKRREDAPLPKNIDPRSGEVIKDALETAKPKNSQAPLEAKEADIRVADIKVADAKIADIKVSSPSLADKVPATRDRGDNLFVDLSILIASFSEVEEGYLGLI